MADLDEQLRDVGARHREVHRQADEVDRERAGLIAQALAAGYSTRKIGTLVGISHQRVSQVAQH